MLTRWISPRASVVNYCARRIVSRDQSGPKREWHVALGFEKGDEQSPNMCSRFPPIFSLISIRAAAADVALLPPAHLPLVSSRKLTSRMQLSPSVRIPTGRVSERDRSGARTCRGMELVPKVKQGDYPRLVARVPALEGVEAKVKSLSRRSNPVVREAWRSLHIAYTGNQPITQRSLHLAIVGIV